MMRRAAACLVLMQGVAAQTVLPPLRAAYAAVPPSPHASLLLPFDARTAVAAFWSGPDFVVVADQPLPALSHLSGDHGLFSSPDVTVLERATVIRLHLPAHPQLSFSRQSDGWILQMDVSGHAGSSSAPSAGSMPVIMPGAVLFPQKQAGRVLMLPDPASGQRLLIAPSLGVTGGVPQGRRAEGYSIRPSLEGLVIAADSPQIALRGTADGVVLDAVALAPLPVGEKEASYAPAPASVAAHGADWVWLGFGSAGGGQKASSRQPSRLDSAQAAFASGQPWQALRVLDRTPASEAPATSTSTSTSKAARNDTAQIAGTFLRAAASLLAGHTGQAQDLNDARFGDAPATRVWRGLYLMQTGQNSQTASTLLAAGFAQMQAYPAAVRALMVPQAATYVARFGDAASAALLEPLPDESAYDLARALLQARAGQAETARVALENLTASSSAQTAAYARAALVGLMLEKDMISPAIAAEAYGKLLENEGQPAALPSGPKATIRLGQAHAFALAGQPQAALAVLDRVLAGPDVPEDVLSSAYLAILRGLVFPETVRGAPAGGAALAAPLSAADRIGLIAAHLPHVEDGPAKAKLLAGYGRLLLAGGRLDAAMAAFGQAALLQDNPVAKADAEDLLAQAALQAHRLDVAQRALDRARHPGLPEDLATQCAYDAARLAVALGDPDKALNLLEQDETDAGLELRGQVYEAQKRWPEAVLVLGRLAARSVPEDGVLTEPQQALVSRLATDATAAQDSATLLRLKGWLAGRTLGAERDERFAMQIRSIKPLSPAH